MSNYSDTSPHEIAVENATLKAANIRQEQEIEYLKAENIAARTENTGLRDAVRADRDEILDLQRAKCVIEALNRDLAARNFSLEEANRELESFSYAVSHDL